MKCVSVLKGAGLTPVLLGITCAMVLGKCSDDDPAFQEHVIRAPENIQEEARAKRAAAEAAKNAGDTDQTVDLGYQGPTATGPSREATAVDPTYGPEWGAGYENYAGLALAADSYVQNYTSKVDILWVIDSSGSMSEEQNYLGQKFNSFITGLASSGQDFQTAITSTNICPDNPNDSTIPLELRYCPAGVSAGPAGTRLRGSFVGQTGKKVLNSTMSDLITRFTQYTTSVGIAGSGIEHGLKGAEMAIAKSLNGQNETLVRTNSFLSVIVVSDEEDDGIGLSGIDAYGSPNFWDLGLTRFRYTDDDMINYLKNVKGAGNFAISTITGVREANGAMCSSAHSQPLEEGTQYIKAAQKTGGIIQSICSTNWDASLQNIGHDINAQAGQIVLSQLPYSVLAIKVWVNGVQVPQSNWAYNAGSNTIRFNTGFVPDNGADVLIKYFVAP